MQYHYAIELGGSFTTIYVKNVGFALKEPTMVAVEKSGDEYKTFAFGKKAKELVWKTNDSVEVFNPISHGVIENYEYAKIMLEHFLSKVGFKRNRRNALVLIPCGLSAKDKGEYLRLFEDVGMNVVDLVPSIIASAVGSGCNISTTRASLLVNVGGTTTEIAVINLSSILEGVSMGIGGKKMDIAIANSLALPNGGENKRILVGVPTAEKIKNEIGSLYRNDTLKMEVLGVDIESKAPKARVVTAQEIRPVLVAFFEEILRTIDVTINSLPPEISADILKNEICFTGGVARLAGLESFLKEKLPYPFKIVENPEDVTIMGAGKLLNDSQMLNQIIKNA